MDSAPFHSRYQQPLPLELPTFLFSHHPTTITAHTNPSGLVFFWPLVWVHAGLWGGLRTAETGVRGGK
ncbi:hypothetical protein [Zwartia sp.]|uniref:hypothetical protein n=1 Tax=Zwartia sp. TaxID=2978004 RepID=UPI003BAECDDF